MSMKKEYGQFFTTNYKYITTGMTTPEDTDFIEPFAGNQDMLKLIPNSNRARTLCYDIDPKLSSIIKRDTLLDPPDYKNKFIITNPPYLARNKSKNKTIFVKYNQNDLYKCFIVSILQSGTVGGIIIIPLNFWSSIRKNDVLLRKGFVSTFNITRVNVFEEQVFDDTTYAVCCVQFSRKMESMLAYKFPMYVYPSNKKYDTQLDEKNNYTIGGKIYKLPQCDSIKIERLTKKNQESKFITNIKLYALDSNSRNKIRLEITSDAGRFIDETKRLSERSFATMIIKPCPTLDDQKNIVERFNTYLERMRTKYNSLFLSNYRESSDIARKRISFALVYRILNYIIAND